MATILVIDDETVLLRNVRDALELEGYNVLAAEDGLRGIKVATEHLPNLVICDLAMPILDGFTVHQELRTHAETRHIPLIFITGMRDVAEVNRMLEARDQDYLFKPFTLDELLSAVRKHLESAEPS